jgi:hypothetical protein
MIFENCSFLYNEAIASGGVFAVTTEAGVDFRTFNCYVAHNVAGANAGFAENILGDFYDVNSTFFNNSASQASVLISGSYSNINFSGSFISQAFSKKDNTLMFAGGCSAVIDGITIENSRSKRNSAGIGVYKLAKVTIMNSLFRNNSAIMGVVLFTSNSNQLIHFINCTMTNNRAGHSLIFVNSGSMDIINLDSSNNRGVLLVFINSNLHAELIKSKNEFCDETMIGCFAAIKSSQSINFIDIQLQNITSLFSRGIFWALGSSVIITRAKVESPKGAFINFILSETSELFLVSLNISIYKGNAIRLIQSKTFISDSFFLPATFETFDSRAVFADGSKIEINHTAFSNNKKSAVYVTNSAKFLEVGLILNNCDFINNINELGGGIYLSESNITVSFCRFINNTGLIHGGAIYLFYHFTGIPEEYDWTFNNSLFDGNLAEKGGGGALYWNWNIPKWSNSTFLKNKANFGNDMASQPVRLTLNSSDTKQLQRFLSGGILSSLTFLLFDYYNQIVTTSDNSKTKLSMRKAPWSNDFYEMRTNNISTVLGKTTTNPVNGKILFENIRIIALPTSSYYLYFESEAIPFYLEKLLTNNQNEIINEGMNTKGDEGNSYVYRINVNFSECIEGQIYAADKNTCEDCGEGTYSLVKGADAVCMSCPANARCRGKNIIEVAFGYWRSSINSSEIFKCYQKYSCVGGYDNICLEGFHGILCGVCADQSDSNEIYFLDMDFKCKKCSGAEVVRALTIVAFILLGVVAYTCFVIRQKMTAKHTLTSVLLKLLTDFLQVSGLISTIEVAWPVDLKSIFQMQSTVNNPDNFMVGLDCGLDAFFSNDLNIYFKKSIIIGFVCIAIPIIIAIFWYIYARVKSLSSEERLSKFLTSFVITFFTYQPMFVNQFFGGLICKEINGKEYLTKYVTQECWNNLHLKVIFGVILPFLALLMFILPFFFFRAMYKGYRNRSEDQNYSFLTNSYSTRFFFWDFVNMIQKYTLIAISAFLTSSISCAIAVLLVTFVFLILQIYFEPYRNPLLNKIALLSRTATHFMISTLLSNLVPVGTFVPLLALGVFIFSNGYFLLIWAKYYIFMNKKVMVCIQNLCFCIPTKSFYIDAVTGNKTFFEKNSFIASYSLRKKKSNGSPTQIHSGSRTIEPVQFFLSSKIDMKN